MFFNKMCMILLSTFNIQGGGAIKYKELIESTLDVKYVYFLFENEIQKNQIPTVKYNFLTK